MEVATAPGSKVMPPEYGAGVSDARSGCSPSDILKLLNTKAGEEGIPQSWDYRSVHALVSKAAVARENDATGLVQWLQERLASGHLGLSLHWMPVCISNLRRVGAEARRGKWAPSVMFTDLTQLGSWHQARVRRRDCPFLCVYHIAQNLQDHLGAVVKKGSKR